MKGSLQTKTGKSSRTKSNTLKCLKKKIKVPRLVLCLIGRFLGYNLFIIENVKTNSGMELLVQNDLDKCDLRVQRSDCAG